MSRPRKYEVGKEPGAAERSADYFERLKLAGGKRRAYNWRPAVVEALGKLKQHARFQFQNETEIVSTLIIEAANASATKKRGSRQPLAPRNSPKEADTHAWLQAAVGANVSK